MASKEDCAELTRENQQDSIDGKGAAERLPNGMYGDRSAEFQNDKAKVSDNLNGPSSLDPDRKARSDCNLISTKLTSASPENHHSTVQSKLSNSLANVNTSTETDTNLSWKPGKNSQLCPNSVLNPKLKDSTAVKMPDSDPGSVTSMLSDGSNGSVLSFHNVSYTVKVPVGRCKCGQSEEKFILKDVSGLFRPGVNAILGPTGSGKTSLLDVLAGRKDPSGLTGQVLVDGAPQPANFKCMAGYVIQDDIVMGMLTVRENIEFSAALRLPKSVSRAKRSEKVEEIITELGLTKCADTKVGTPFRRGVSGGERKRTNIAMELITSVPVLFLDEPTTGLDSSTAYSVMHLLNRLARKGKTIVFSIHQPRYAIFKLFDNMLLLNQGGCVYQGSPRKALQHFRSVGYECEEHNNPPDFFLDILNGVVSPADTLDSLSGDSPSDKGRENEKQGLIIDVEDDVASVAEARQSELLRHYQESPQQTRIKESLDSILKVPECSDDSLTRTKPSKINYSRSFPMQLCLVGNRTFRNMVRNPHTLGTQIASGIILALLVGTIYFQVDNSFRAGIQNRVGAFFFIVMNYVFGNMSAMDMFIKDRVVFVHENISGYYRVSSYFFSKLLCDVTPQRVVPIIIFASISYWMIGLSASLSQFGFYGLNILLTSLAGTSVALLFSATVATYSIGSLLTALVWLLMMVFSGLLVNIETIPAWLRWLKWTSIFRYSMNAFSVNELKDAMFCDTNNGTSHCDLGNEYMERQGIPYETSWDLWFNEVMLVVITTCFLALAYIQLRRIKKLR